MITTNDHNKTHKELWMNKLQFINIIANLLIVLNIVLGFMQIHWAVIGLFVVLHAVCRMTYLKAESATPQNTIAPPMIRTIASVITAIILAVALYWLGFGLALLIR